MDAYEHLPSDPGLPSWQHVPTSILRAELLRRLDPKADRPACGSQSGQRGYNTPAHVAALVIILLLSTLACSFPIVVRRFPSLPVPHRFLFLSRHFGTGVLIATAFVHLLPTAFVSLHDPCLPRFWNKDYPAAAGLIAMVSMLITVGIEMFFASRGAGHVHGDEWLEGAADAPGLDRRRRSRSHSFRGFPTRGGSDGRPPPIILGNMSESRENLIDGRSPSVVVPSPMPRDQAKSEEESGNDSDLDLEELTEEEDETRLLNGRSKRRTAHPRHGDPVPSGSGSHRSSQLSEHQSQQKLLLQVLLLEAGILFHSVFIGMALSVATGTPFVVLLIAISFHQTFEGFALGARISQIDFPVNSVKPWLMALAYGTTTPVGQAIGLMLHRLYDPASEIGLLTVGTMNSISSGLLLYAGLVTLLAEDFLSDESYKTLRGRRRLEACAAVVSGAGLMALVGAWA